MFMTLTLKKSTLITEGILIFILGVLALLLPVTTSFSLVYLIGLLCMIAGIVQLIRVFQHRQDPFFWLSLFGALLAIVIGILLLSYPVKSVMLVALLLGIWFLFHGVLGIGFSLSIRHHSENWGFMFCSGILSIVLALIIWCAWPWDALWVVGLLFGVNLVFFGMALFALAFRLKAGS